MGDRLSITGGANGITARYDDLLAHARLLDEVASDLGEAAATLARVNLSPDIAGAAVLCPIEVADAEAALVAANVGPHGVAVAGAKAEASAAFLRFSVTAYREVDEIRSRLVDEVTFTAGFAVGSVALPITLTAAAAFAVAPNRSELINEVLEFAYDHPWIQEVFARAAPGVVEGSVSALVGGNPVFLRLISGGHWPSTDLEGAMKGLLAVGGTAGLLKDSGSFSVEPVGEPHSVDLSSGDFVSGLLLEQRDLSQEPGTLQLITVQGMAGTSYIVQIPGTQDWNPARGDNPVDLTTNINVMAGSQTVMAGAVIQAMRQAHIPPGAPVMLTGHSQGGIVAATIAADPEYRREFNISTVVTAGSPIAHVPIPEDVSVLSLEEKQDVVPKLDGAANPDRPNWVTVTRDLTVATETDGDLFTAHSLSNYVQTGQGVDTSQEASLVEWRATTRDFFGHGTGQRFAIQPADVR